LSKASKPGTVRAATSAAAQSKQATTASSKAPKPGNVHKSFDPEALLMKAQRYVEQMEDRASDEWQHALWSSFSLELLARAALAKVNPVLLADTKNDSKKAWSNICCALGFSPLDAKYEPHSIGTTEVLNRLGDLLPEFKELVKWCVGHTGRRNTELHSGQVPFDGVNASTWHPDFYRSCKVLLASLDLQLGDFLDAATAATAEEVIAAAADQKAKAVLGEIHAAKRGWKSKSKGEQKLAKATALVWANKHDGHRAECPACGSTALVVGDPVSAALRKLKEDEIFEVQEYLPNRFECIACGLRISGLSRLTAAGLSDRYKKTRVYDAAELYAPEDEYQGYEDDNNEPYDETDDP
jgi:hypothetical protein